MKIIENPDKDFVREVRKKIKEANGHCPCQLKKTADTKCMCKQFRDMVKNGVEGECHCGLYIAKQD